jgi:pimeloyl-ACP methyl ester carboxylesterase
LERFEVGVAGFTFDAVSCGPEGGRTVMFLHGFPQTWWSWHRQLEAIGASGYRTVAFDQRGYSPGARPPAVEEYRVEALMGDVLGVADALAVERFDIVGHDWGAMVAWVTAIRHAERVRTLTAVSVAHPAAFGTALAGGDRDQLQRSSYIEVFRQPGVAEMALLGEDGSGAGLRQMFGASGLSHTADVDRYVAAMREPGALTAALNWYRAESTGELASLGPATVPTLYVWSTEDVALGRVAAEKTAEWVTGPYRFEILQGVSHWIPETAAAQLNRLLLEHLAANVR